MIDLGYTCTRPTFGTCTNTHSCGDGVLNAGEECDDGNNLPFNECSSRCTIYTGYTCNSASPTVCTEICDDGLDFHNSPVTMATLYILTDVSQTARSGTVPTLNAVAAVQAAGNTVLNKILTVMTHDYGWYGCDDGNTNTCEGCNQYGEIEPGYICNEGRPDRPDRCWPS